MWRRVGGCSPCCVEPFEFCWVFCVEVVECCDGGLCCVLPEPCCGVDLAVPVKRRSDPFPPPPPRRAAIPCGCSCARCPVFFIDKTVFYDPTYTSNPSLTCPVSSLVKVSALHSSDPAHSCRRCLVVFA